MTTIRIAALTLTLVWGGSHAVAHAQDATEGEAGSQPAEPTSSAEQLAQAKQIQDSGSAVAARLQGMLGAARDKGDIVKVTCLNDKLTQANANLRTVAQRMDALRDAVAVNDAATAKHELTVLSVLGQRMQALSQEGNQCVGQDVYEMGASQVVTEVDSSAPTFIDPATGDAVTAAAGAVTIPPADVQGADVRAPPTASGVM